MDARPNKSRPPRTSMSFTSAIRRPAHILNRQISPSIKRRVSNKPTNASPKIRQTKDVLPPAKMRALISLYHQTDTVITSETLSKRIDQAFTKDNDVMLAQVEAPESGYSALRKIAQDRRFSPKSLDWNNTDFLPSVNTGSYNSNERWSGRRPLRETLVMEALYGVEMDRTKQMLPGWEVLEESTEDIERNIKEDMEEDYQTLEENHP